MADEDRVDATAQGECTIRGVMKAENRTLETEEWSEGLGDESTCKGQGGVKKNGMPCVTKCHQEL